jgi:hypothetical protein
LEGSSCEAPSCGDTVSTAKTTLLPANHSFGTKKGLHSNERLDDTLDPQRTLLGTWRQVKRGWEERSPHSGYSLERLMAHRFERKTGSPFLLTLIFGSARGASRAASYPF